MKRKLQVTVPDVLFAEIEFRAEKAGMTKSKWLLRFISDELELGFLTCTKCGVLFEIENEGGLREDGPWCDAHLYLSRDTEN